jgi:hypothetical protein
MMRRRRSARLAKIEDSSDDGGMLLCCTEMKTDEGLREASHGELWRVFSCHTMALAKRALASVLLSCEGVSEASHSECSVVMRRR